MRIELLTKIFQTIFITSVLSCIGITVSAQSPYAIFGDKSVMLEAKAEPVSGIYRIQIRKDNEVRYFADFDFEKGIATLSDMAGNIVLQDSISENAKAMFTTIDPHAESYYHLSPYSYCGGNPVNAIDPDGKDIYMLFYTTGNGRGDDMFKSAAETRKYDIEHSVYFNASNDIVLMREIQDISSIESLVGNIVGTYGDSFGKTAEFSIWSHAGVDGPTGTTRTSQNALDGKQMTLDGWNNIDFNWAPDANANFYGCKTGVANDGSPSFSTRISSLSNYRNINVHGQTSSAYPSRYTNVRQNTQEMINGSFSYPTYMVGGSSLGIVGRFFPTHSKANPMRTSRNGRGTINNYYQPGRRH
ncbi:MAG: hypothetical protein SPF56_02970 [Bacteroidaceae bacterium]|nr:hypothetical protein [Prevotellaceae bacterium]MDY5631452.1 hypothetical protein [Bacteroidaceae bacterium]